MPIPTKGALASKARAKLAHQEQLKKAVEFVLAGKGGAQRAAAQFDGCSKKQIEYAVLKQQDGSLARPSWSILTEIESTRLAEWLHGSAKNDNPATEDEITFKVKELLQARKLANRKKKDGYGTTPLSPAEWRLVYSTRRSPS